eukprot:TRINITY_DN70520_c0_g1_i1.p1 TRINITY_DN70520_c0_g1~~TRINITY_DN70520_c0_g1_i1.p1  ORF type:complete len:443 (+),score=135.36 TRINITY_DN70520_c0_g1_i1:76-1329(+)
MPPPQRPDTAEGVWDALRAAGPGALLARPELVHDALAYLLGRAENKSDDPRAPTSDRGEAELASLRSRVDDLTAQVADLIEYSAAQADQLNHARQAITILHDAHQRHEEQQAQRQQSNDTIISQIPRLAALEQQTARLERLYDIMAERVEVSGALVERLEEASSAALPVAQTADALALRVDDLAARTEELISRSAAIGASQVQMIADAETNLRRDTELKLHELRRALEAQGSAAETDLGEMRREVKRQEKRMVAVVEDLARRFSSSRQAELDAVTASERQVIELAVRVEAVKDRCDALQERKVDLDSLNALFARHVRECAIAWGDELDNLYRLLELGKDEVRGAVSGSRRDRVRVLHNCPSFASVLHAVQMLAGSANNPAAAAVSPDRRSQSHPGSFYAPPAHQLPGSAQHREGIVF